MQVAQTNSGETQAEVLEIIREMPGVTSAEIVALMPHRSKASITSMVFWLKNKGTIEESGKKIVAMKNGVPKHVATYTLSSNPTPNIVKMKRKAPTEAALHMQIKQLVNTITELEAWKRDAISRYPDLAVDPTVLKARKLVSEEVRAGGDHTLADQIMLGRKDDTLMMRVTIKALEEGND